MSPNTLVSEVAAKTVTVPVAVGVAGPARVMHRPMPTTSPVGSYTHLAASGVAPRKPAVVSAWRPWPGVG